MAFQNEKDLENYKVHFYFVDFKVVTIEKAKLNRLGPYFSRKIRTWQNQFKGSINI